jgi:autotransporter-associated beta strand protein
MSLGDSNAGGETNTVKVHGDAVINNNAGEMWIGQGGGSITVMDVYENASVTNNNWVAIGRGGGTGTLNIKDNATFIKQGTGDNYLAIGSGGTGVLNQTGGTLISTNTRLGEASNGTMNLTGGSATFTGEFSIGRQGNLIGTLNVGGTANVTVPNVVFGATGNGTSGGSVNLSGTASLTANAFTVGPNSTGPRTIKFDGGTLKAAADTTNFIGGKITGVVSAGGATIDTNGHNATVNSALTHDATLGGADGGLTKTGAGILKLAGVNNYTGNTTVSAGTLQAVKPGALPGYATSGTVSVASGATLAVNAGGTGEWAVSDIATARASVTFASGSALGIDTSNAAAPVVYDQVLPGPVGLTKLGAGTLKLTAANTYTGPTVLNGSGSVVLGSDAWAPVLTNAGGAVVNGDKLVFDYTGTTSPAGTVVSLLKSSHDSSNFRDAAQQIRTTIAADATHGLGYYDDGGASLLTVLYTWYGDANLDGKVNADDYALTDRGMARGGTKWVSGDFNYDGVVNGDDYLLLDTSFVQSGGALSPDLLASRAARFGDAYVSQLIAAVPEPGSLCLLGLGATVALTRRRRSV